MEWMEFIDKTHGMLGLLLSIFALLLVQLLIKIVDFGFKHFIKREAKKTLDIRRAFIAIRILSGDEWHKVRDEMMRDDNLDL